MDVSAFACIRLWNCDWNSPKVNVLTHQNNAFLFQNEVEEGMDVRYHETSILEAPEWFLFWFYDHNKV